jgi:hypothetical protein
MASTRRSGRLSALPSVILILLVAALGSACAESEGPLSMEPELLGPEVGVVASAHAMGQASKRAFTAQLAGANEVPPVATRARGQAVFRLSADGTEISYRLIVANIENVTQAHIHVGAEGVNGPVVVWLYPSASPAQLIPGRSDGVLATGVITEASLVGQLEGEPLDALIERMRAETVYVNVHTSQFPPGEIRGQIR